MFLLTEESLIRRGIMNSVPLFKFYEVVKVVSEQNTLREINGLTAAVLGMVQGDQGKWRYGISVFDTDEGWDVMESDLVATGSHMKREDFYDGSSIQIVVDPETGEGNIK